MPHDDAALEYVLAITVSASCTSPAVSSCSFLPPTEARIGATTFSFFLTVLGARPASSSRSQSSAARRTV